METKEKRETLRIVENREGEKETLRADNNMDGGGGDTENGVKL